MDNFTVQEMKQIQSKQVELLGYDLSIDNDENRTIKIALEDTDPSEFLKSCEHLRVSYFGTSMMGRFLGLPTLGQKLIWCKETKHSLFGVSLQNSSKSFKERYCSKCDSCTPRDENWNCTVKWIEEEMKDPEIREVIEKYYKSLNQ